MALVKAPRSPAAAPTTGRPWAVPEHTAAKGITTSVVIRVMVGNKTVHPYDIREPVKTVVEDSIRTGASAQSSEACLQKMLTGTAGLRGATPGTNIAVTSRRYTGVVSVPSDPGYSRAGRRRSPSTAPTQPTRNSFPIAQWNSASTTGC